MPKQRVHFSFDELYDFYGGSFPSPMSVPINLKVKDVFGQYSSTVELTCDNATPSAPAGLVSTATALAANLTWTQHTDTDLESIDVYRSASNDSGTATLVARVHPKNVQHTDLVSSTGTYYYWLKATDVFGQTSEFSDGSAATTISGVGESELGDLQLIVPTDIDGNTTATLAALWNGDRETVAVTYTFSATANWLKFEFPTRRYVHGVRLSTSADSIDGFFVLYDEEGDAFAWYGGNTTTDHTVDGTTADEILREHGSLISAALAYITLVGTSVDSHYEMVYEFGDNNGTPASRLRNPQIISAIAFYALETVSLTEFRPATYVAAEDIYAGTIKATRGITLQDNDTGSGWVLDSSGATFLNTSITVTNGLGSTHIADGAIITDKLDAEAVTAAKIKAGTITATQITGSTLSAIYADMGTLTAGQIQLGTGTLGSNFTGLVLDSDATGLNYESAYWHLVGLDNETLQVGIKVSDGKFYAAGGAVIIGQDEIVIDHKNQVGGVTTPLRFHDSDFADHDAVTGWIWGSGWTFGYLTIETHMDDAVDTNKVASGIRLYSGTRPSHDDIAFMYAYNDGNSDWRFSISPHEGFRWRQGSTTYMTLDTSGDLDIESGTLDLNGSTRIKNDGLMRPKDASAPGGADGDFAIDTGNDRIGINVGGTWKWVAVA